MSMKSKCCFALAVGMAAVVAFGVASGTGSANGRRGKRKDVKPAVEVAHRAVEVVRSVWYDGVERSYRTTIKRVVSQQEVDTWAAKNLPDKIKGLIGAATTEHEKKMKKEQSLRDGWLLRSRVSLVEYYRAFVEYGLDRSPFDEACKAYRDFVDAPWGKMRQRGKMGEKAEKDVTEASRVLDLKMSVLHDIVRNRQIADYHAWSLSHPENVRADELRAAQMGEHLALIEAQNARADANRLAAEAQRARADAIAAQNAAVMAESEAQQQRNRANRAEREAQWLRWH